MIIKIWYVFNLYRLDVICNQYTVCFTLSSTSFISVVKTVAFKNVKSADLKHMSYVHDVVSLSFYFRHIHNSAFWELNGLSG